MVIKHDILVTAIKETKVQDVHAMTKTVIIENNATLRSNVSLDPPDAVKVTFGKVNVHIKLLDTMEDIYKSCI